MVALAAFALAWAGMLAARRVNRAEQRRMTQVLLALSALLALAGCLAGLAGPFLAGMDPTQHSYPAIVWVVAIWTVVHGAVGVLMQLYCLARSLTGRLTARYDMDLGNVVLYWHFMVITAVTAFAVIGLFPLVRA